MDDRLRRELERWDPAQRQTELQRRALDAVQREVSAASRRRDVTAPAGLRWAWIVGGLATAALAWLFYTVPAPPSAPPRAAHPAQASTAVDPPATASSVAPATPSLELTQPVRLKMTASNGVRIYWTIQPPAVASSQAPSGSEAG